MSKILDFLHKGTVLLCIGTTVYGAGFLVVRMRDIQRKSKELDEYAKDEKLTYAEAAARLGYTPLDENSPFKVKAVGPKVT
mmetsp:Transcript_9568/g.23328  ORF Transcript_9568/g.23328 Transcript_9568/m.23328 type:complete len:81 (+) Transcript_9568:180-422(+)|eukprot:CAMPEP_0180149398 /NCGR_PEP_ID=MMETSP0986-20121125/20769_1 /TAXON_ID=697907 /ORGANISM="non described non described, Strain CCMP2293" /LENGTH=80 /DNA_ID=CAMNT_0022096013 /DNA_START=159 /DNA_END=401 /DNA_ORIENTATION=-